MRKLIVGLVLAGACHASGASSAPSPSASTASKATGGATPAAAVRGFMVAAKKTDLKGMGALWGDQTALARDRFPREELQKRELYMMRCLRHDSFDIVGDAPSVGGARAMVVQLSYGDLTRSMNVEVVRGPAERWYVRDFDVKAVQEICMVRS